MRTAVPWLKREHLQELEIGKIVEDAAANCCDQVVGHVPVKGRRVSGCLAA